MSEFLSSLVNAVGRFFVAIAVHGPWWLTTLIAISLLALAIAYIVGRLRQRGRHGRHEG